MRSGPSAAIGVLPKPLPIIADRPEPKIASASPAAYWLVRKVSASTPNSIDEAAPPASAPARIASGIGNPASATPKASAAPISIMPSMPRLRTPDFSTTSSPSAASTSGVAAMMVPVKIADEQVHQRMPSDPADAVEDEEIGGQQEEQQDALEHPRQRRRQAERHLHGFAAEEKQRHQQPAEHDAEAFSRPMKATMMAAKP